MTCYVPLLPKEQQVLGLLNFVSSVNKTEPKKQDEVTAKNAPQHIETLIKESQNILNSNSQDTIGYFLSLFNLLSDKQQETVLKSITNDPKKNSSLKYQILDSIYRAASKNGALQKVVFLQLCEFSANSEDKSAVSNLGTIEERCNTLQLTKSEKAQVYKSVFTAVEKTSDANLKFEWGLNYLNLVEEVTKEAEEITTRFVNFAISSDQIFNFKNLYCLKPVLALKQTNEKLFNLFAIFSHGNWNNYKEFTSKQDVASMNFDHEALQKKIKLLTLASMNGTKSYAAISKEIEIPEDDVESFIISGISEDIFEVQIDQSERLVTFQETIFRSFNEQSWKKISDDLNSWKFNVQKLLTNLRSAQNH